MKTPQFQLNSNTLMYEEIPKSNKTNNYLLVLLHIAIIGTLFLLIA